MDKFANAVSLFNKIADLYQDKFMYLDLYNDTYDLFCDSLKKNAEILELACGPGNITKYLLEKRPDLNILATDMAPNMLALAKANNPTATFQIMDSRDIATIDKKYDGIMVGFCLPYLDKEETRKLITDASKILNDGGIIYLSTLEGLYNKSGWEKGSSGDEVYVHYYTAEDLVPMLESNDFEIVSVYRKDYFQEGRETTKHLILIAKH